MWYSLFVFISSYSFTCAVALSLILNFWDTRSAPPENVVSVSAILPDGDYTR